MITSVPYTTSAPVTPYSSQPEPSFSLHWNQDRPGPIDGARSLSAHRELVGGLYTKVGPTGVKSVEFDGKAFDFGVHEAATSAGKETGLRTTVAGVADGASSVAKQLRKIEHAVAAVRELGTGNTSRENADFQVEARDLGGKGDSYSNWKLADAPAPVVALSQLAQQVADRYDKVKDHVVVTAGE